jgi:8-oxo-dGTP pyrophosphatase MutT (NUDIX family)
MREAVHAAILKKTLDSENNEEKEILIVKSGDFWTLPGGMINEGESDLECLCREVKEQLSWAKMNEMSIIYYKDFEGKMSHSLCMIRSKIYLAQIKEQFYLLPSEVNNIRWTHVPKSYQLSEIALNVINSLIDEDYI